MFSRWCQLAHNNGSDRTREPLAALRGQRRGRAGQPKRYGQKENIGKFTTSENYPRIFLIRLN